MATGCQITQIKEGVVAHLQSCQSHTEDVTEELKKKEEDQETHLTGQKWSQQMTQCPLTRHPRDIIASTTSQTLD